MKATPGRVLCIAIFGLFLLSACGGGSASDGGPAAATPTTAQTTAAGGATRGEQLFAGSCISCHGPAGEGIAGLGKDLTSSEFVAGTSDAELIAFIKQGRPSGDPANTTGIDMPPKGGNPALNDQDLADLVAFLRTLPR